MIELRLVRGGAEPPSNRSGIGRHFRFVMVLCVTGAMAFGYWTVAAGRRAASSIPDEQRVAIVQRTFEGLKQTCGGQPRGFLQEHCRELASFLSQFEECRGECEAVVQSRLVPNPTR